MKRIALFLAVVCLLGLAAPSRAEVCNLDVNPAATLLLPYFEVDLNRENGVNTVFSINNAFDTAILAHVTIWSDLSVPVLDFNTYLTGYDMQVFDLRELFVNGIIPSTASDGQDPVDAISPQGPFSQDINFASCTAQLPTPLLPQIFIDYMQAALTGKPSVIVGGRCVGRDLGDRIARGYITVDTVNNCTLRFATDVGYFGPGGDVTNQNALFGDYTIFDRRARSAEGNTLVHIEASDTNPETSTPGQYTFYGRYVNWSAADNREPLPTTFGARYTNTETDFIVWRDSKVAGYQSYTCPADPAWSPLGQEGLVVFDEQENPVVLATSPVSPAASGVTPFPVEAQRTTVGGAALPVPFASGWAYLNLNTTVTAAGVNPPEDPAAAQAWVSVVTRGGRFGVGYDAMRYDNACNANHDNPGF